MFCWKCGCENYESSKFCGACGASLQIKGMGDIKNASNENRGVFCWKCGNTNSTDSKFCSTCGANLQNVDQDLVEQRGINLQPAKEVRQPQMDLEREQENKDKKISEVNIQHGGRFFQIVGLVFAGLYLLKAIITIPNVLEAVGDVWGRGHIFVSFGNLLVVILMTLSSAIFAFMLGLFSMRHTRENEEMLYLGVALTAGLRVVVATINMIWNAIYYFIVRHERIYRLSVGNIIKPWFKTFFFVIFIIGVLFILFLLIGRKPFAGKSLDELKQMMKELPVFLQKETEQFFSDFVEGKQNTSQVVYQRRLKTNRGLFVFIILSILTCGIYQYIFYYEIAKDINEICEEDGEHTAGLLKLILFSILTCGIYWIFWLYQFADRLANNAPRYGVEITENGTTVLLWLLLGFCCCGIGLLVALYIIIRNLNRLAKAYNEKNTAQIVTDVTENIQ